jgi:hypothetical protein
LVLGRALGAGDAPGAASFRRVVAQPVDDPCWQADVPESAL